MPTDWTTRIATYSRVPGFDPAIDWAIHDLSPGQPAPGRRYYFVPGDQQRWMPVVILLNKGSARDFWEGVADGDRFISESERNAWWTSNLRISPLFLNPPRGLEKLKFFSATVTKKFLDGLLERELVPKIVARIELSLPLRARSLPPS
jgi:hypothetical protein